MEDVGNLVVLKVKRARVGEDHSLAFVKQRTATILARDLYVALPSVYHDRCNRGGRAHLAGNVVGAVPFMIGEEVERVVFVALEPHSRLGVEGSVLERGAVKALAV